ncbi:major facilitator superfamily domain-containing protein [Pisolithus marmoratus]|nr:major facilitator superfamily domain-containing protein [Pisolithus marmoratus]
MTIQQDSVSNQANPDDSLVLLDPGTEERSSPDPLPTNRGDIPTAFKDLDRSNLGNARLQGLPEDTLGGDPTGALFDRILFQVPWTVFSKYHSPRLWIGSSAILWGLCSTLMSTANNFPQLLVARLALGVFEAAFGPSVVLYFSYYYTKSEYGTRVAYWFGFAAVAGAFGGLLAYGIQNTRVSIAHWRLLFLLEGLPTILLGMLCVFMLPGRPESTDFLTPAERKLAVERINRGTSSDIGTTHMSVAALLDWRVYVAGIIYFGLNCALGSLSAFLPTIISTMGFGSVALSQLMVVPPYAAAGLALVIFSYLSDKMRTRGLFIIAGCTLGGHPARGDTQPIRPLLLHFLRCHWNVYEHSFDIGVVSTHQVTHNLGSETKRATGVPLFGAIGQCGSILGSHLYPLTEGPAYRRGFGTSSSLMFLAAICALVLNVSYRLENRRRDDLYGEPELDERVDTSVLADKAPLFRYIP